MPIDNKIGLLEKFAQNNSDILPNDWTKSFTDTFGVNLKLYDFQKQALMNALVVLYYYFNKDKTLQKQLFKHFEDLSKKDIAEINKTFNSYQNNIIPAFREKFVFNPQYTDSIHPLFFNQMCFWMATGSGKTLVIIKMIEILHNLMKQGLIGSKDILISSANDSIITQIKEHIHTYNIGSDIEINFIPLKKFDKASENLAFNKINVYFTTSGALAEEQQVSKNKKDGKRINYETVYNNGNWYVFLDEAHKGTEDSKTQAYFQLLASNGFLFNFSATFTEPIRKISTVYNMNLEKFINAGYGKEIKVLGQGFNTRSDDTHHKQISILQSLLLLTAQKISKEEYLINYYHNPLLLVFAHSINSNTDNKDLKEVKTDLKEFFNTLHSMINGNIEEQLFDEAKRTLLAEIKSDSQYTIGSNKMRTMLDFINKISLSDIAHYVLYSPKNTKLQSSLIYLKLGKDKSEVAIQLKTADRPFALLKFSDAHKWIEEILVNAEELDTFDGVRSFATLNDLDNTYTMLLGSRMFVEGWDSNRPNLIHFIGLGKNDENTKLILQAIGRGVRIEPITNHRKRNSYLSSNLKIDPKKLPTTGKLFNSEYEPIALLEMLFIFATNTSILTSILKSLKNEKDDIEFIPIETHIQKTDIREKPLLVPEYDKILLRNKQYKMTSKQLDNITQFLTNKKKVFLLKDASTKTRYREQYLNICEYLINKTDEIQIVPEHRFEDLRDSELMFHILEYFTGDIQKLKKLRELEDNDIIHYQHMSVRKDTDDTYNDLVTEIVQVMQSTNLTEEELLEQLHQGRLDIGEYSKLLKELALNQAYTSKSVKKIDKHYYNPTLFSEFDYTFKNAIDVESEQKFIDELIKFIKIGLSPNIEWWYFSKLNQHHDKKVYIPYTDKYNFEKPFYPDFIFWIKCKSKYKIVFVDPKGLGREEDPRDKLNGFKNIFNQKEYIFDTVNNIEIELYYFNEEYNDDELIKKHRIDSKSLNKIFE